MRQLLEERKRGTVRRMAVSWPVAAFAGVPGEHEVADGVPGSVVRWAAPIDGSPPPVGR